MASLRIELQCQMLKGFRVFLLFIPHLFLIKSNRTKVFEYCGVHVLFICLFWSCINEHCLTDPTVLSYCCAVFGNVGSLFY